MAMIHSFIPRSSLFTEAPAQTARSVVFNAPCHPNPCHVKLALCCGSILVTESSQLAGRNKSVRRCRQHATRTFACIDYIALDRFTASTILIMLSCLLFIIPHHTVRRPHIPTTCHHTPRLSPTARHHYLSLAMRHHGHQPSQKPTHSQSRLDVVGCLQGNTSVHKLTGPGLTMYGVT